MEYPDQLKQRVKTGSGYSGSLGDLLDEAAARDPSAGQLIDRVLSELCPRGTSHEWARATRHLLADGLLPAPEMAYRAVRLLAGVSPLTAGDVSKPMRPALPPSLADLAGLGDQSVGRDAERTQAVHELTHRTSGVSLVCITGPAGVGKTRLASEIMQAVEQAGFAPRLRISLRPALRLRDREDPALAVYDALLDLLIALGIRPSDVPATLDGRQALYRATLKDRRPLILLDGAVDENQVLPLLPPRQGAVLITSRRPLAGLSGWRALELPLTPLDRDAARLLIQRCFRAAGPEPSEAVIAAIRDGCGGMPVPIMAVSRWMIAAAGRMNAEDAVITMDVLFSMLSPGQQLVMWMFGSLPVIEADIPMICLSTGLSHDQVLEVLEDLEDLGWVARRPHNGFVMDGNIAAYAGATGATGEVSPGKALAGLVLRAELRLRQLRKLMTAPEIKARVAARDWVYEQWRAERELTAVLLDTAAGTADPSPARGLASVFMDITELTEAAQDGWRETQRYIGPVLRIARAANDPTLEARALLRFGGDDLRQGAAGRAAELFRMALRAADDERLSREIEAALEQAVRAAAGPEPEALDQPPSPGRGTDRVPDGNGLETIGAAATSGGPAVPGRPMLFGSPQARTW